MFHDAMWHLRNTVVTKLIYLFSSLSSAVIFYGPNTLWTYPTRNTCILKASSETCPFINWSNYVNFKAIYFPPYYIFLFPPPMSIKENWEPLYSQYCNDTGEFLLANHSKALTWNKIISGTRKTYSSYKWDYWTHCLYQTTLAEIHKTSTRKKQL